MTTQNTIADRFQSSPGKQAAGAVLAKYFLIAALPVLGSSCASTTTGKPDPGFARSLPAKAKVAVSKTTSKHAGSHAKNAAGAAASSGVLPTVLVYGIIGNIDKKRRAGEPVVPTIAPAEYLVQLDQACSRAVGRALHSSGRFTTVPVSTSKRHADIHVKFVYAYAAGVRKRLKLEAYWKVYSPDGTRYTSYKTVATTSEKFDILPNSTDQRYRSHYINLAFRNAQLLMAKL